MTARRFSATPPDWGGLEGVENLPTRVAIRAVKSYFGFRQLIELRSRETRAAVREAIASRLEDLQRNPDWIFR